MRITWWLIFINLVSFLASAYATRHNLSDLIGIGGILPAEYKNPQLVLQVDIHYRELRIHPFVPLIWYQFLHGGWFHLLFNCLFIFVFGPNLEAYMGSKRFLVFYVTCGAVGAMTQIIFNLTSVQFIVGASACTSGLLGAYLRLYRDNYIRITFGDIYTSAYRDLMLPIKVFVIFWIATQLLDALIPGPEEALKHGVAYLTHLGGFVAGFILGKGRLSGQAIIRSFHLIHGGKSDTKGKGRK